MNRTRKRYTIGYLIFILILGILHLHPWPNPPETAGEAWNRVHPWFGPAPVQLELDSTYQEAEHITHYHFQFAPDAEKEEHIITLLELQQIPASGQQENRFSPSTKHICLLEGGSEWGYVVENLVLTRSSTAPTQLEFSILWDADEHSGWPYYRPTFDHVKPPMWQAFLMMIQGIAFMLSNTILAPLGFLLLFPSFTLTRWWHHLLWYAAVFIPQVVIIYWLHTWLSGPPLGVAFGLGLTVGIPFHLFAAWILGRIARRHLIDALPTPPSCAE
ncbi:MAG: hypothetical protein IKY92_09010 [Akkermansia sp.]|nr:hypothetical protein [Akkermansia sp.]